ncbi:hypothetical protein EAV90_23540 [Bradyrhizobium vignae]|nr:hypothetical protein EAV90_23540 [Bradyrhizobium vignae]
MDMREASAMTEASGLINEQGGIEQTSAQRSDSRPETRGSAQSPHSPSLDSAMRWADQLREVTTKAPLRSLFVAFLLGAWLARRR